VLQRLQKLDQIPALFIGKISSIVMPRVQVTGQARIKLEGTLARFRTKTGCLRIKLVASYIENLPTFTKDWIQNNIPMSIFYEPSWDRCLHRD
jgi:hypothetical protein